VGFVQTPDDFVGEVTAAMSRGDEEAYRQFYELCFDKLYRHLLVKTRGDEALAKELSQLVLLRVVRYIKAFPSERVLWAWLYQLCRSVHVDWLRRNAKALPVTEVWNQEIVEAPEDADEELLGHLENSLELLEENERELVRLAYFEAVPQRAIAERNRTTPKAVESKLARIRHKLRHAIMEKLKEYALL
jgi:RNA polymerase sigma factor (sigma-70 family)